MNQNKKEIIRLGRKRRKEHTKAEGKAFTLVFDEDDRFVPVPMKGNYKQKYNHSLLHPIFLLKSQAEEYARERIKQKAWTSRVVIVEIEMKEL